MKPLTSTNHVKHLVSTTLPEPRISFADEHLVELEAKINALLPPRYVGCFEDVSPGSMGSAKLRYDEQGRIAWGEIWTTFCHLALAGGPPHRGRLLAPVSLADVEASPDKYRCVVAEIERAIGLAVDLPLSEQQEVGWVGIQCLDDAMANWLVQAIVAENVHARRDRNVLFVPAGPHFRAEKEIKNVVVSVAKSCHYFLDHLEVEQRPSGPVQPLIAPPLSHEINAALGEYQNVKSQLEQAVQQHTGLLTISDETLGWLGIECVSEEMAVWMLRAVAVENVLVRREEARLFIPIAIDPTRPNSLITTLNAIETAHRSWIFRSGKA